MPHFCPTPSSHTLYGELSGEARAVITAFDNATMEYNGGGASLLNELIERAKTGTFSPADAACCLATGLLKKRYAEEPQKLHKELLCQVDRVCDLHLYPSEPSTLWSICRLAVICRLNSELRTVR